MQRTKSVGMGTEGADILVVETLNERVIGAGRVREARRGREEERERSADCIEGKEKGRGAKRQVSSFNEVKSEFNF